MLIPLFNEKQAGYVTLDLQIAIMDSLRPIMREPKEVIMEGLVKDARPGASIYFLRRGAVGAMASLKNVCFYEISSASPNGAGAIIGENALMAKGRSICTYTASSRCELYALGIHELHKIVSRFLNTEEIDEMAEMIYDIFAKRHMIRAIALRLSQLSVDGSWQSDPGEASHPLDVVMRLQRSAALRLQVKWAYLIAHRIMHVDLDERPMSQLVPGLYQASWEWRRARESASKRTRATRATVSMRRPSFTDMQIIDRASLVSPKDSNPPSQRGNSSGKEASDSFITERTTSRRGTSAEQDLALADLQRKVDKLTIAQEQLLGHVKDSVKDAVADAVADAISGMGRRVANAMVVSEDGGSTLRQREQGSSITASPSRPRDQGRSRLPSLPSVAQLPGVRSGAVQAQSER